MKYLFLAALLPLFAACSSTKNITTQENDFSKIKSMVAEKNIEFVVQRMNPAKGLPQNITSFYHLKTSNDSLYVQLPYIGQAYIAPVNPGQSPYDFISTSFDFQVTAEKADRLNITIKPRDKQNVQQFSLVIYDNGNASLSVNSSDRQGISYDGYIAQQH